MQSKKYYERLLILAGVFLLFFVITFISLPLIIRIFDINQSSRDGMLLLSVCQAVILFIAPALLTARIFSRSPFSYLQLDKSPGWMPVIGVIFFYLIALPFLNQLIFWNSNIVFPEVISHWGENLKELEENAKQSTSIMLDVNNVGAMIVNLLIVGLLTAFAEEMFFRGSLQHTASLEGNYHASIWIVALIFSAMHFQAFGFVPRFLLGAWFGYLLYWTRSLYVPVFAHFLNNGVVVVCAWLSSKGATIDFDKIGVMETGFPMPAFVSALATLVFLVFFRSFFFEGNNRNGRKKTLNYV